MILNRKNFVVPQKFNIDVVSNSENGLAKIAKMYAQKEVGQFTEALKNNELHPNICPVKQCITTNGNDFKYWGTDDMVNDCLCKHVKKTCAPGMRQHRNDEADCAKFNAGTDGEHRCYQQQEGNVNSGILGNKYFIELADRFPNSDNEIENATELGITRSKNIQNIYDTHKNQQRELLLDHYEFLQSEKFLNI